MRSPGVYAARKGERLSSILQRAGGFTKDAFLRGAIFTRVSVQKRQQEIIDRMIDQLEQDVVRTSAKEATVASDKEDVEAQKQALEARKLLIVRLKIGSRSGADHRSPVGSREGGGNRERPRHRTRGPVDDPAGHRKSSTCWGACTTRRAWSSIRPTSTVGYYLRKVGGPTEDADRDHIFVVQADGSVLTKDTTDQGFWMMGDSGLMSAKLEAGDAIVVPEKLIFSRTMKDVKDITQIMMQLAVTLGVFLAIP